MLKEETRNYEIQKINSENEMILAVTGKTICETINDYSMIELFKLMAILNFLNNITL